LAKEYGINSAQLKIDAQLWWWHPTKEDLRLSYKGHNYLKNNLKLFCYHIVMPEPLNNRRLIKLVNYCQGPFFIKGSTEIFLYSQADSVFLALSNNNIDGLG
jgi:hypothetical protein